MEQEPLHPLVTTLEDALKSAPRGTDTSFFDQLLDEIRAQHTRTQLGLPEPIVGDRFEGFGNFETWAASRWVMEAPGAHAHWGSRAYELLMSTGAPEQAIDMLTRELHEAHATKNTNVPLCPMPQVEWRKIAPLLVELADT